MSRDIHQNNSAEFFSGSRIILQNLSELFCRIVFQNSAELCFRILQNNSVYPMQQKRLTKVHFHHKTVIKHRKMIIKEKFSQITVKNYLKK